MRTLLTPLVASTVLMFGQATLAATATATAPATARAAPQVKVQNGQPELATELARIRQATQRYRDIHVALAEGYIIAPPGECITAASEGQPKQLGAMGLHVVRPDRLGITAVTPRVNGVGVNTDFAQPSVLVYEPQPDGKYELVALENLIFAQGWLAAGNTAPPSFFGNEYYLMIDNPLTPLDEAHGFEPHYELHMWLYRENPAGMFMPFNTRVSCGAQAGH